MTRLGRAPRRGFLVVTEGEALHAAFGHFDRPSIQIVWCALVLPALLLNYRGHGALVLANPKAELARDFLDGLEKEGPVRVRGTSIL